MKKKEFELPLSFEILIFVIFITKIRKSYFDLLKIEFCKHFFFKIQMVLFPYTVKLKQVKGLQ